MRLSDCACPPGTHGLSYKGFGRREVLKAAGAGFVASLIEALAGSGHVARAETVAGGAPEIDKLTIRFVTDNNVDRYASAAQFQASPSTGGALTNV